MFKKIYIGLIILLHYWVNFNSMTGYSQSNEIEDKVVIIEKEAKLDLPVANRNYEKIIIETPKVPVKIQNYSYSDIQFELSRIPARIKVPTIPPDPLAKLYGNYVKAGFGNYTTPYLEAFINSKRNDKWNYGLHLKHISSKNGSVKADQISGLSGNSLSQGDVYLHYFLNKNIIKARSSFSQYGNNYYGFNKNLLNNPAFNEKTLKDTIKQHYNIFSLYAGFENTNKADQINYNASVQFFNTADRFKAKENEIVFDLKGNYDLDSNSGIKVLSTLSITSKKEETSINRNFFQLKPTYYLKKDNWKIDLGINVAYTNDTIKNYDKIHFYPALSGEYVVDKKLLTLFGSLNGEMIKNTYRSLTLENPFLKRNFQLGHTNKALDFTLGSKGNFQEKLNYNIQFSYINYKNLYFFNNSYSDTSKFDIFYVRGSTNVLNFKTDFSYEIIEKLRMGLQTSFNSYGISSDTIKAWHRPTTFLNVYATYNLYEKINFKGDFYYIGGLKGRNFITHKSIDTKLPSVIDLNLKVDYNVSEVFSIFIELNNILSRKISIVSILSS